MFFLAENTFSKDLNLTMTENDFCIIQMRSLADVSLLQAITVDLLLAAGRSGKLNVHSTTLHRSILAGLKKRLSTNFLAETRKQIILWMN